MTASEEARPVVTTGRGKVRGIREQPVPAPGEAAVPVAAFRGVPYAASPVGERRFAAPLPHPGRQGVRDAARPGPSAPQAASRLAAVMGPRTPDWDEDGCLNLNVWTPAAALAPEAPPRAVLVWFHGGGWSSGSGGWDWYDGARLAALGDIVVVTANYRLGPLGFLHLPAIGAANLGNQDQAAALRWVHDTVAAFGGDPGRITVGGQSAGACAALSLALDPATGDLVQRVIAQSGPWGLRPQDPADAAENTSAYLRILGLDPVGDPAALGRALRMLPAGHLVAAYGQLAARSARPGEVAPPMYPVLGGPGVPRTWQEAVAEGALGNKELLLGATEDEMTAFLAFAAVDRSRVGPLTGRVFGDGVREIAGLRAAQGTPAHVYRFTRRPVPDPHGLGATHCAELPFLFGTFDAYPEAPMLGTVAPEDHALARAFGSALAAFTATGSPNAPGLAPWPPWSRAASPKTKRF
ncbi:carboxylesterase [Streptomyces sp. Ru73]|uniref:carboxylesterase family protein n=1 Tax=Streptomyces sp. Ru73 TaxID=2080748 RepID=UPI000CDE5208|nr:carboxylesterase family protein [Streptomyces sp. Ru73]POX38102.1 carboxylesterase [Streptomyces sp. Ru73]